MKPATITLEELAERWGMSCPTLLRGIQFGFHKHLRKDAETGHFILASVEQSEHENDKALARLQADFLKQQTRNQ